MTFYSYAYLVDQNKTPNFIFIIATIILAIALLFTAYRYYKNRNDNKYRDLLIIFLFAMVLVVGINYNNYEKDLDVNNKTNQTIELMESIAKNKDVSAKKLYSNSSTLAEGMLIKNGKTIYRVSFDDNQNSYTLTKVGLVKKDDVKIQK